MKRHNQGPASTPNAPLDLTPLLDIIFIFLFVVIINNANVTKGIQDEANKQVKILEEEKENLKDKNEELNDEVFNLRAREKAQEEFAAPYENLSDKVSIVQIHCEAKQDNKVDRTVIIETPEGELLQFDFNTENRKTSYARIKRSLSEYIDNSTDDRKIVLSINTKDILAADMENISRIVNELEEKYKNVI